MHRSLQNKEPWWKTQFFISEPVLFGMWDGVFTSCLINIFGVIVFLRSGWIVAQAGILNAVLIVLCTGNIFCSQASIYTSKSHVRVLLLSAVSVTVLQ